ncbi:MAG TPA: metalloregulator ArsR/SmtB family transcription factor [Candidatus Limnocylindrales bacterium]|nr:metalloregulator ArsR/SmtB family transcription factor [Candidatus Limnocylindrales bacterium]
MAGRPATRSLRDRPTEVRPRPAVRDLSRGPASFRIDWDVRPAYDFMFSLTEEEAGTTDDLPAEDRAWLANAKASLPARIKESTARLFESGICINAAVAFVDRPDVRTADEVVEAMRETSAADVIRAVFEYGPRDPGTSALIDRAIEGDAAAITALEETLDEHHKEGRLELLHDPEGTVASIVEALAAWAKPFAEIQPRVTEIIERDYADRAADRATLAPIDLIERTTGGIRWLPESGVRRVILAPSYFSRPYNFLMSGADWRLFAYPVADSALEPDDRLAAPQAVVRLHRALGDETRLRILKLLAGRDLYLTEIAQQLELSKPTIKHHLALLRAAGLVTVTESGAVMYYSLRRNRLDDASADIKRFLIG